MRHDDGSEFCGGSKYAKVTHEVLFGGRYQGTDSTHELLRAHEGVGHAVVSLFGEFEYDLIVLVADDLLVGEWRSRDVAAETLKALAVMGGDTQAGVHGKTMDFGGALVFRKQGTGRGNLSSV